MIQNILISYLAIHGVFVGGLMLYNPIDKLFGKRHLVYGTVEKVIPDYSYQSLFHHFTCFNRVSFLPKNRRPIESIVAVHEQFNEGDVVITKYVVGCLSKQISVIGCFRHDFPVY